MKVVSIEARDVYVTLDFSLKQINYILDYLSRCTVEYNSKEEPEMAEADKYVKDTVFPNLEALSEDLKNGPGPNSP